MSNFVKKLTSTVGVATLVAVSTGASLVAAASEFLPYAEVLADAGVINTQSSEAGYRLGDTVTRAELAKVVANLGDLSASECTGSVYSDVGSSLGDLCNAIEGLADAGVVSTASATFRPLANVTRAEMVKMILGSLGEEQSSADAGYTDIAGLGDLTGFINRANELGCAKSTSLFRPSASSSRGEAFKIAACVAQLDPSIDEEGEEGETTTPTTGGSLTVALDGTAMAQYVPMNASAVKVGSVKLTAGTSDVTVSSLVVSRSGLGNIADVESVVLAQNGVNVSDARTMSTSSQTATLKFTNPLVIKAKTSTTVDVLVNLNGGANNQHQFALSAVNTLNGATVSGAPVTLGLVNTTSYTVGSITVDDITTSSVTSGKSNQLFATVKLTPNKAANITGFTLTKSTGEDYTKVFSNVSAYFNGTKVGTVTVGTDKLTVTGLNISRESGEQASIELRADVIYVGPNSTATFKVDSSSDVSAVEKATGYATTVSGAPTAVKTLNLDAVDLTITKTTTGTKTVAPGTSAVELYNATISSDATFDVSNYTLALTTGTDLTNFSDNKVTVYINGVDYEVTTNTKNWTASADRFRVEPGAPITVRVVGNVRSNATVPADYVFTFSISEVKNVSNGAISTVTKSQQGDKVTVKSGTTILKDATVAPATSRAVYANAEIEIGRFAVRSEAENTTVRKITVTNAASSSGAVFTDIISSNSAKLIDVTTGQQISATVTVNASSIVFDSMSAEVLKDTDRNFKVVVNTTGFDTTPHGDKIDLGVTLNTVDKASGGSALLNPGTLASVSSSDYVVGVRPPVVTMVKKASNVFLVTIQNVDSESDIQLNSITAQIKPVADNNSSYSADFCLTLEGASDANACGSSTGGVPGAAKALTQTLPVTISKNSSVTREIFVQSNFVNPVNLLGEISKLAYETAGNATTETYSISAQ